MTVAAGAFVAEILGDDAFALGDELHAVCIHHLAAIHPLVAAVPYAENDPSLRFAVYLHSVIAATPATGHIVSPHWVFQRGDLAVKCRDVAVGRRGVIQMHRSGVAPLLEIEVRVLQCGTIENERVEISHRFSLFIERGKREGLVTRFWEDEFAESRSNKIGAAASHLCDARVSGNGQLQFVFRPGRQPKRYRTLELARGFEFAEPGDCN